ncbi:MAG: beta-lactamase family protein [Myxococcales bacterium]|nr:beta-lactamase family protein [Myxococcales bacterium]
MSGSPAAAPVDGHCDARFAAVREAFRENFAVEDEVGAAVCVYVGGRCVVDLWGGHADAARTRPWRRDTLVNAYSVGKGILAVLVANLVERGQVELDAPVAKPWPEFAAAGKGGITFRTLLSHRAGLPAVRERLPEEAAYEWERFCAALAAQSPWWEPGTAHGYHVNTLGFLVGEVVRRVTGCGVGDALQRNVCGPAGAEFWYGLPKPLHARVAEICVASASQPPPGPEQWALAFPPTGDAEHDRMIWHCYFNPARASGIGSVNTQAWRLAAIPSTNGHGTARGVAAIYSAFLRGGPGWAGPGVRAEATRIHSDGEDRVLARPSRFGLGFQLTQPSRPLGAGRGAFGHYGYGGSLGFADPDADLAFAYLMNRPGLRWQTPRSTRLVDAVHACLA